jgi:glycosyltransferase involved in cell wall biosynthesis
MSHLRIVFWWPGACRSIVPLIRELAQLCEGGIRLVVQEALGKHRRQFGWQPDNAGDAQFDILPLENRWQAVEKILLDESHSLHVIGGYQGIPLHRRIITFAQSNKIDYGIMAEAPINLDSGWKAYLKDAYLSTVVPIRTLFVAEQSHFFACLSGRRYDAVLKAGWPHEKIYPFGYFPDARSISARQLIPIDEPCRLLCMGTLVKYKGVDILLRAVAMAQKMGAKCVVEIVGDGPERQRLQYLSKQLKLEQRVTFHGFVADLALDKIVESSDVLVCPGIAEPWGIRINEGIQSGLVVVSSDRLGASELISSSGAGILFRSGDAGELAEVIRVLCQQQELIPFYKRKAIVYSKLIHPQEAAKHFLEIIQHSVGKTEQRPLISW